MFFPLATNKIVGGCRIVSSAIFMLDEGRYFKGKEVVKRLLGDMADLKMNVFHWHLTNDQGWTDVSNKDYPRFLNKLNFFLQKWNTEGIMVGPVQ